MKTKFTRQLSLTLLAGAAITHLSAPASADVTPECNDGAGLNTTECGSNSTTDTADSATVVGAEARAIDVNTTAVGAASDASGNNATAVGASARAPLFDSTAVGGESSALGVGSTVIGSRASSSSISTVSVGALSSAEETGAIAIGGDGDLDGTGTQANGVEAIALGSDASATGNSTTAVGGQATATGPGASAYGWQSVADAERATALGHLADAGGVRSVAVGEAANASGDGAVALGNEAVASGSNSVAIGNGAQATNDGQVVVPSLDSSTGSQMGALNVVTADANGTLGINPLDNFATASSVAANNAAIGQNASAISTLQGQTTTLFDLANANSREARKANEGVALALSMESPVLMSSDSFGVAGGFGYYNDRVAGSASFAARISERTALTGGLGIGFDEGEIGARAGFQSTW